VNKLFIDGFLWIKTRKVLFLACELYQTKQNFKFLRPLL